MADMHHDWFGGNLPQRYVLRDIGVGISTTTRALQFGFLNSDHAKPLNGQSILQIVDSLGEPTETEIESLNWVREDRPETPLDLEIKGGTDPIYIIFRIAGPPNMYFQPGRKAISHKSDATEPARNRYGRLRHVRAPGQHDPQAGGNCKVVYFACKPSSNRDYDDGLNLWVRLIQPPRVHGGADRILDIIIDPDVGYPGGSAVEP